MHSVFNRIKDLHYKQRKKLIFAPGKYCTFCMAAAVFEARCWSRKNV